MCGLGRLARDGVVRETDEGVARELIGDLESITEHHRELGMALLVHFRIDFEHFPLLGDKPSKLSPRQSNLTFLCLDANDPDYTQHEQHGATKKTRL